MTDVVCCLTPPGMAALAVVAFYGPTVWPNLVPYFRPTAQPPTLSCAPTIHHGRLLQGDLGDDVVLVLHGDEHCQFVEVQSHGSPGVVAWLLQLAAELGCQPISWEQWLTHHASPGSTPGYAAALWSLLPHAITRRTAAILLDQCHGAFDRELARLRAIPDPDQARAALAALRRWHALGQHLLQPWKVALAGAPNAGKSSLFNALLGFDRAITAPTPGTTRDVVTATLVWQGFPFELLDTAGLRNTTSELEAAGINRAVRTLQDADIILALVDLADPHTPLLEGATPTFVVGAKADLPRQYRGRCDLEVSAHSGQGLTELLDAVLHLVLPELPSPGQAVPLLPEQLAALDQFDAALSAGRLARPCT